MCEFCISWSSSKDMYWKRNVGGVLKYLYVCNYPGAKLLFGTASETHEPLSCTEYSALLLILIEVQNWRNCSVQTSRTAEASGWHACIGDQVFTESQGTFDVSWTCNYIPHIDPSHLLFIEMGGHDLIIPSLLCLRTCTTYSGDFLLIQIFDKSWIGYTWSPSLGLHASVLSRLFFNSGLMQIFQSNLYNKRSFGISDLASILPLANCRCF